jgi:hypothetical protein
MAYLRIADGNPVEESIWVLMGHLVDDPEPTYTGRNGALTKLKDLEPSDLLELISINREYWGACERAIHAEIHRQNPDYIVPWERT